MVAKETGPGTARGNPMQPVVELLQGGDPDAISRKYGVSREELGRRLHEYQVNRSRAALAENLQFSNAGRNDPCPCGSGKKYKKCCLPVHEEARKSIPKDRLQAMEERARLRETLQKEIERGFDLLFGQELEKARKLAQRVLEQHPEDDRAHDILFTSAIASGDYDTAFFTARRRWQVSQEEKAYFQEHGSHKREGREQGGLVHFYSPSTWLEKFWMAERARHYRERFASPPNQALEKAVRDLKVANDVKRFPEKHEEGYAARRAALAPVLERLEGEGPSAVPYLLPLTYCFSWASLFVPDLLMAYATDDSVRLLAELSMFRFPYFAQKCLLNLEAMGDRAIPFIEDTLVNNPVFDELKVGLIMVLGRNPSRRSFEMLTRLTEHENRYVVNWVAEALGRQGNPEALPYLERARERVGELSKIQGAIEDLVKGGLG
ncbi:MAG: hypothetical protein GX443_11705 [Deltaproteobacteria bacterium]|nr:hypothetical protein [Deltaproteobacteria bacterium]